MKICVGLSGGVDSSVAAMLLKESGADVFALFMQNWHDASTTLHGDCEWEEDKFMAEMVARRLGIPFYFIDLSKEYRERIVDYMFSEYEQGRTPNPDVLCNREIKFDVFLKAAERLGADAVATGHYCRKEEVTDPVTGEKTYKLLAGVDKNKDQSYFLCQLNQEQLSKAIFPIGHLLKPEVRDLARQGNLQSAEKKDSQGLCFVGKVDLPTFLQQALKPKEGDVIEVFDAYFDHNPLYAAQLELLRRICRDGISDPQAVTDYISEDKSAALVQICNFDPERIKSLTDSELDTLSTPLTYEDIVFETEVYRSGHKHVKKTRYKDNPWGKIIGKHDGAQFYTIGQRKGLNIGGHADSVFVIHTDTVANKIFVGEGHKCKGLSRSCLKIENSDIHYINPALALQDGAVQAVKVRIRYRQPLQDAFLVKRPSGLYIVFWTPQRGITPGQFAAWYDGEDLQGSGVISK